MLRLCVRVPLPLLYIRYTIMQINSEGRPTLLTPIYESPSDEAMWAHCFGAELMLDSKANRAVMTAVLYAHNIESIYTQKLKRR